MTHPPRHSRTSPTHARASAPAAPIQRLTAGLFGIGITAMLLVALLALEAMHDPAFAPLQTPAAPAVQASSRG